MVRTRRQPKPHERKDNIRESPLTPVLRFSTYAWAKLLFFRDAGDTEIGGFGITDPADPLLVADFVSVQQEVTCVTVAFNDQAVADYFEDQVAAGLRPEQFGRIWIHTHPGMSPSPSSTDEATFARVFGSCDWAPMFILAKGGQRYGRLRFNVGPGGEVLLESQIDFSAPFGPSNTAAWFDEYQQNVRPVTFAPLEASESPSALLEAFRTQRRLSWRAEPRRIDHTEEFDEILMDPYGGLDGISDEFWQREGD